MSHANVFMIIDAGRPDYIRPESMPFLHGLAKRSLTGSFESPPGFAQRTVFFSGRYPDTSGNFSAFVFDPENSPFQWVRKLGPLGNLVRPRKVMFPARMGIRTVTKMVSGAFHTDPAWIPPKFLPYFRPCEDMQPVYDPGALGATSVFDLCRQHGKKFRYLAHPVSGDDDEIHGMLVRELRTGSDTDLYVAQFSVTDEKGHVHGPFSDAMQKRYLRELDEKLASVHAALDAGYDSWNLFICGDHGMGPVKQRINILEKLKAIDAEPAKDYVVFVNSTIAVFWYLTDKGRDAIEAILPQVEGTTLLSEDDRKKHRIPTDRRWGDRMLAADPGVMFWPDYFHVADSTIRGMHGYIDKIEETYGMVVLASSDDTVQPGSFATRPLVDVFPTLCDMLDLPTPPTAEGSSLMKKKAPEAGYSANGQGTKSVIYAEN